MRRYLGRLSFALSVLFLISTKFVDITVGAGFGRHPAETAWSATGLMARQFSLDYWVSAPAGAVPTDLRRMAQRLGTRIGAERTNVFAGEVSGIRFANLDGKLGNGGELVLTIQVDRAQTQIGISCYYDRMPPDLLGLERRIRLSLAGSAARGKFSWEILGQQPDRLRGESWRAMWVRVLASIDAVRRGVEPGDDLIEAYSPLLPANRRGAGTDANLALAVQYDGERRVSLVTLASPDPAGGI